jgi:hypothetical protein
MTADIVNKGAYAVLRRIYQKLGEKQRRKLEN